MQTIPLNVIFFITTSSCIGKPSHLSPMPHQEIFHHVSGLLHTWCFLKQSIFAWAPALEPDEWTYMCTDWTHTRKTPVNIFQKTQAELPLYLSFATLLLFKKSVIKQNPCKATWCWTASHKHTHAAGGAHFLPAASAAPVEPWPRKTPLSHSS